MVNLQGITFEIGTRRLLNGIDWVISQGSRSALIGPNGAGKTTLLKIICGETAPDSGVILKPKDYLIGYLPQEETPADDQTVLSCAMQGRSDLLNLFEKIDELRHLAAADAGLLHRLGELEHRFELAGGYRLEHEAKAVLSGLGFRSSDFERSMMEFSGGMRMRVHLARLLLMNPDLLLLDEPTNHLDLPSLEWLEQYLGSFRGSIVVVSHDRYFIDRIASQVCELTNGRLRCYSGNYRFYEQKRQEEAEQAAERAKRLAREKERQQQFIERFRYKATKARQVQSRIKMLERLEEAPQEEVPAVSSYSFRLSVPFESYHDVLQMQDVWFAYDQDWILEGINLTIHRGQKLALVGENGAGKTTLTRLMVGSLKPQRGRITLGKKVAVGYYAQHQTEALNLGATVFDEVAAGVADSQFPHIRDVLGLFGFRGDDVFKPIAVLSGGEKARVSLTKILLSPVNFLIMDEPTNHLDVASKEALEEALRRYNGTVVLISHDRYFLDKLVHRVIEIKGRRLREYEGNYTDYLSLRPQEQQMERPEPRAEITVVGFKTKEEKRREAEARQAVSKRRNELTAAISEIESRIDRREQRKAELELLLSQTETYKDGEMAASLGRELHQIKQELEDDLSQWESAHIELENLLKSIS